MYEPKILIITTDGINCNEEMSRAFELAGGKTYTVHLNEILSQKIKISNFDIIGFPGGFSYGDYIKSGKIFSQNLFNLKQDIEKFILEKKLIIGICNGFQVLTNTGLIPKGRMSEADISLSWNNSAKYECRWVKLKVPENCISPWLSDMSEIVIEAQAAHAEGQLFTKDSNLKKYLENGQVCFQYVDDSNIETELYPYNPNGTLHGIAGLCDTSGQIIGMMPHPERNSEFFHHPNFRKYSSDKIPTGLHIFKNGIKYIQNLNK